MDVEHLRVEISNFEAEPNVWSIPLSFLLS
jgi:hypothetical protein